MNQVLATYPGQIIKVIAMGDYLKTKAVAERFRVSVRTINHWIDKGHFPNARKKNPLLENSPYEIPLSDILDFEKRADLASQKDNGANKN